VNASPTIAKHKVVGSKPITRSIQILSSQFKIVPRVREVASAPTSLEQPENRSSVHRPINDLHRNTRHKRWAPRKIRFGQAQNHSEREVRQPANRLTP
jgi:hypothetical protein